MNRAQNLGDDTTHCRSELARDGRKDDAINQKIRIIVHDHREQARSYRGRDNLSGKLKQYFKSI
ncbi:hypothetical protein EMIT0P74_190067 [Pseudomonas sp. IT-P74]